MAVSEQHPLQFHDLQRHITGALGSENWLTVYQHTETQFGSTSYFSAVVDPAVVEACLKSASWDLCPDGGLPGFVTYPGAAATYLRFGDDEGSSRSSSSAPSTASSPPTSSCRRSSGTFTTSTRTGSPAPSSRSTRLATSSWSCACPRGRWRCGPNSCAT